MVAHRGRKGASSPRTESLVTLDSRRFLIMWSPARAKVTLSRAIVTEEVALHNDAVLSGVSATAAIIHGVA